MIQYENKLIHGDSLTVLRQMEPESVDAIITRFLRTITIETSDTVLQTHRLAFAQVDSFTQCQHVVFGIIT